MKMMMQNGRISRLTLLLIDVVFVYFLPTTCERVSRWSALMCLGFAGAPLAELMAGG